MSGHNKWSKIKRTKGVSDAKKGKIYTKLIREVSVAVKLSGSDPKNNPRLRDAIAAAKLENMPKVNLERAIQKAVGDGVGENFESIIYEAIGPAGVGLLIEALTDNKNRTVADIRAILVRNQGRLAEFGSVLWMFEHICALMVPGEVFFSNPLEQLDKKDQFINVLIEVPFIDLEESLEGLEARVPFAQGDLLRAVKEKYSDLNMEFEATYFPKVPVVLSEDNDALIHLDKLCELLEDLDDVQKVHLNLVRES